MHGKFVWSHGTGHKQPQAGQARPDKPLPQTKKCLKMLYFLHSVSPHHPEPQHNWMTDMKTVHYFLLGIFVSASVAAQAIYETQGKNGPVFSDLPSEGRDLPSPGATEVKLPPLNLSDAPPAARAAQPTPAPVGARYQSLSISQPASGGTIHSNTGKFSVHVAIDPALQVDQGDVLVVSLDNHVLPRTHTTLKFEISASEWQMAAADNVEHQLQVSVMDRSGKLLLTSAPQSFYAHRATQSHRAR